MGLVLRQLLGLIRLLHSDTGTVSLALGVACGFVLGVSPLLSLQSALLAVFLFTFRIQLGAAMATMALVKPVAYLAAPLFDQAGGWVLSQESLLPTFMWLAKQPIVPWTRFNNTVVMGAGVVGLLMAPLVFVAAMYLVRRYRSVVRERIRRSRWWKLLSASSFFRWYQRYQRFAG